MVILKVHGYIQSSAVMRIAACLNEKGLEFEFVPVDMMAGEHKKEPFLSLNPFGQIPVFEDGDLKLFESRAITRYIAHEHANKGTKLITDIPKEMAIISMWMEVETHQFDPLVSKLTYELIFKSKFLGLVTDEAAVKELKTKLAKVLDVYEARLSQSKYLAGDEFTLADLHHLPNLHYLMNTPIKEMFMSHPHFWAWCADILARPSWSNVIKMQN
ncbi:hypothetical protein AQUCO_00300785v1 [Aquilegia coerulea]|uniref:glutathione transferase n=2 Tax=Magnoliopsida TaxID=3398 RepID=A0A2G5F0H7_AQUCA|nr:hypothetical protein AQUCO_00300785v1 [Aquilegia coerulea]